MHSPRSVLVKFLPVVLAALFGTAEFRAQSAATGPAAAPTTPARAPAAAPVISPDILPDHRVTFRLKAPKATTVTVSGQFVKSPAPMTKDADGIWSVTLGPIAPDIYEYSFNVDGLAMIDAGNRDFKPMRNPRASILEIPGAPPLLTEFQDVPHGSVTLHWYASKSLARRRPMQVYTPPGYDRDTTARFPILYLLHGSGDNEATWVAHGHAHWLLDNLIAQGRAKPMIVVMLDGHAIAPGSPAARTGNTAAFERDLLEDAMPLVAAHYRIAEGAANRAIIGLSMGGGQSLSIGLRHADLFAWVGGMSSSIPEADVLPADAAALNGQLKLLWFACGKDDSLVTRNTDFDALLTTRGVQHEFSVTEGNHSWPVWRKYLAVFAPRVFQAGAAR